MLLRSLGMAGPAIVHIEFKSADFAAHRGLLRASCSTGRRSRTPSRSYMKARQLGRPQRRLGARRPGAGARADRLPAGRRSGRRSSTRWRRRAGACWCAACRSRAAARSACSRIPTATCSACGSARTGRGGGGGAAAASRARQAGAAKPAEAPGAEPPAPSRRQAQEEVTVRGPAAVRTASGRRRAGRRRRWCSRLMALATKLAAARLPGPQIAFIRFADRAGRLRAGAPRASACARATSSACSCAARTAARPCCSTSSAIAHLPVGHRDAAQLHGAGVHGDLCGRCSWARRSRGRRWARWG